MAPPVAGYYAWYDASQISGVADGTVLTSWPDLSGNSRDLNVHTGTPTFYKTTSAKLINGNPAVWFNADGHMASTATFTVAQPMTIFVVATKADAATGMAAFGQHTNTCFMFANSGTGGNWTIYAGTAVADGASDTALHVHTVQFNGASSIYRLDGTVKISAGNPSTGTLSSVFVVGDQVDTSNRPWYGPIGEVIVYPSALSTANMASVESYLTTKWTTTPGVTGTAAIPLGPLAVTATGVPLAASAVPLGPVTVTASGTPFTPTGFANLDEGPILVASGSARTVPGGGPACVRMAWLTLGGLSTPLQDETAGYFCSQLDLGFPTPRDVLSNRPDRNGAVDRTQFFGIRTVTIQLEALTGAGARVDEIAGLFAPYLDPSQRPVLHYVLDRAGTPERTLTLRAAAFTAPIAGPYQRSIQLQFVAADPIAHDPLVKTVTGSMIAVGTISTAGDLPVWPRYRITGPVNAPNIQFVPTAGFIWWLAFQTSFTITAGHFVDIDTDARTVYIDGDPGRPALGQMDWTISSWQSIPPQPASTDMSLFGSGPTSATNVTAYWQDGYLS